MGEVSRFHLGALRFIGQNGHPKELVFAAAAAVEAACQWSKALVGDEAWHGEVPHEDPHWLSFGCSHYVVRFAAASSDLPFGGAPPPALLRVAAFGRPGDDSV